MSPKEAALTKTDPSAVYRAVQTQLKGVTAAFAAIVILGLIPIAGAWYGSLLETWAIYVGWLLLFAISYHWQAKHLFVSARANRGSRSSEPNAKTLDRIVSTFMVIGALGAAAVIYDFAYLRNYGFTTSAATIRLEEVIASLKGLSTGSPISGAGRLAIPAFVPGISLLVLYWKRLSKPTLILSGLCLALLLLEQFRFEGGRFFLTAIGLCAVFTAVLNPNFAANRKRLLADKGLLVRVGILGLLLLAFYTYVFAARVTDRNGFFWSAFINYANNFYITIDRSSIERFDGAFGSVWFSITMLWMYATQGLSEFDQLVRTNFFQHAYGGYQFLQATQISDALFGTDFVYDRYANLPHMGTYVTLPGAFFIDFGPWLAVLSGAIFGTVTARASWRMVSGNLGALALSAPVFLTCSYLASVVSLVQNLWPAVVWSLLLPVLRSQLDRQAASNRQRSAFG